MSAYLQAQNLIKKYLDGGQIEKSGELICDTISQMIDSNEFYEVENLLIELSKVERKLNNPAMHYFTRVVTLASESGITQLEVHANFFLCHTLYRLGRGEDADQINTKLTSKMITTGQNDYWVARLTEQRLKYGNVLDVTEFVQLVGKASDAFGIIGNLPKQLEVLVQVPAVQYIKNRKLKNHMTIFLDQAETLLNQAHPGMLFPSSAIGDNLGIKVDADGRPSVEDVKKYWQKSISDVREWIA